MAMHPAGRYADVLIGRKVRLPIVGRIIPIIADEHVVLPDPKSDDEKARYSTGFLKVTPAHDPDDWLIGQPSEQRTTCVILRRRTCHSQDVSQARIVTDRS